MSAEDANLSGALTGLLLVYVAFDWGDEVDLEGARQLEPAAALELARRPRTPGSFAYKPSPLRFALEPKPLTLTRPGEVRPSNAVATVFDFGAVSVALRVPFALNPSDLTALAGSLADPDSAKTVVAAARSAVTPLFQKLLSAVSRPQWDADL
jgi:hypothetical protein